MTKALMEEVEEADMTKALMEEVEEVDMTTALMEEVEEADMTKAGEVGAVVDMIGQNKEDVAEAEEKFKVDGQTEVAVIKILAIKGGMVVTIVVVTTVVATKAVLAVTKEVATMEVVEAIKGVAIKGAATKEAATKDIKTTEIKIAAMNRVEDEVQDVEVVVVGVVEGVGDKVL
eukprot:g27717.t1